MNPEIVSEPSEVLNEEQEYFNERLKNFIVALAPDDEKRQQKLLKIAVSQFAGSPVHLAKRNCNKCYGNGFTAFDRVHEYFIVCHRCFKL